MPANVYKDICSEDNFLYLNGKNVLQPKVSEIINDLLDQDKKNYVLLRNNLFQFKNIFQYVYANVYPEIYCSTKGRGFDLKSTIHIVFKVYKDKKRLSTWVKTPQNYQNEHTATNTFEQKPIKIDDFNDEEEKEVKERVEKRKMKTRQVAKKNKLLKT